MRQVFCTTKLKEAVEINNLLICSGHDSVITAKVVKPEKDLIDKYSFESLMFYTVSINGKFVGSFCECGKLLNEDDIDIYGGICEDCR